MSRDEAGQMVDRMSEQTLVDAEERYRLVGRATNDVIWDWDRRTGLVVWSESLRSIFGYEPNDAGGPIAGALQWWGSRIHAAEREAVLASFMAAANSSEETWAKEYRFLAADGSYRQVIDRGYIARDPAGEPTRMIGSMQDITALRRGAEERERLVLELEGERRKLETILQQLPVGVIVADPTGRIVFANRQVEAIWRHPVISTSSIAEYGHWRGFHPDGTPLRAEEWPLARALTRREVVVDESIHFERGDGSGRGVMDVSASPIEDAAGTLTAAVVVFNETTERARTLEMARAAQLDAEAASRLKDEFLAVLSHELRTPLNAILGWARTISGSGVPPERVSHGLRVIERNARIQTQMIADLLDVSAVIRGHLRLELGPVNLRGIVQAAVETVRLTAEDKHITLAVSLDDLPDEIWGDVARLQQVAWNLLSNAVKFTPTGGRVEVVARRATPREVEIVVRDTGKGIDPAFLPHVFERFRQGDATPTREHGGLGLGLAIVRHLVEAHGGSVEAGSEGRDRGATFTVKLPVGPAPAGGGGEA